MHNANNNEQTGLDQDPTLSHAQWRFAGLCSSRYARSARALRMCMAMHGLQSIATVGLRSAERPHMTCDWLRF